MTLTPRMRAALEAAARPGGLRRHHKPGPGRPPWPAHPATLRALERRGLIEQEDGVNARCERVQTWRATEQGRELLAELARPVRLRHRPVWISRPSRGSGDYTTIPSRAIDPLETVDAPEHMIRAARVRHADAQDRRARARRLKAA